MRMLGAVVLAMAMGSAGAQQATFAVASIHPSAEAVKFERDGKTDITPMTLHMRDVTVQTCIKWAYGVQRAQVVGSDELEQTHYDIEARTDEAVKPEQMKRMMQALLAERFKLKFHHEQKEMRRYAMVVLPTGTKNMKQSEPGGEPNRQNSARGTVAKSTTMQEWADFLSGPLETPVVDKTGLTGPWDFAIDFTPYLPKGEVPLQQDPGYIVNITLQGEIGLKLEPGKGPIEVMVVDHLEKPSEN
jgi:uncharacterized protein (TIGR03435 family)